MTDQPSTTYDAPHTAAEWDAIEAAAFDAILAGTDIDAVKRAFAIYRQAASRERGCALAATAGFEAAMREITLIGERRAEYRRQLAEAVRAAVGTG